MKVIAINGSPRKTWNTAILLKKALEGAASKGAETEFVHLNDLNFKGCQSCFTCKIRNGRSYGHCAVQDELGLILKKIEDAESIILGSPIYLGNVTGLMRMFMERLIFPYVEYSNSPLLIPKRIHTGFIYTMNVREDQMKKYGYDIVINDNERRFRRIFGASESLWSTDTYQFDDYSTVVADIFDADKKAKRRKEEFPRDCEKAFEMGVRLSS